MKRLTGTASKLSNSVHQRLSKDALVPGARVHKLCAFLIFIFASFLVFGLCAIAADAPPRAEPWAQMAKLNISHDQLGLFFGTSVAVNGETVVIGQTDPGQALIFIKPKSGWRNMTQTATLIPSGGNGCTFGASVAISGDTIVVGESQNAWWCSDGPGAVYVFVKPAGGWSGTLTQTAKLTASDGATGNALGTSIWLSGNAVVSGAPGTNPFTTPGAAYVFVEPVGGWVNETETAKLTASDGQTGDQLGYSASICGNTVVAGAPLAAIGVNQAQGAIYVFTKPVGGWSNVTQTAKLTASDGGPNQYLGNSAAADGNIVLGGAPYAVSKSHNGSGAAYVYVEPSSGWVNMNESAKLTTVDDGVAALGFSVALDDNIAIAGAPYMSHGQNFGGGAVYVFIKPKSGWATDSNKTRLVGSDAKFSAGMGSSVAVEGHTVVAGAPVISDSTGAAYLFWQP